MYNVHKPDASELPTSRQLLRSTALALVAAIAILVAVVLPAEYAIDPTGIGRMLGLTEMGEIKSQLADEAAADAARDAAAASRAPVDTPAAAPAPAAPSAVEPVAPAGEAWRDQMRVVLAPGEGAEVKLVMQAGHRARFTWAVEGGTVNFDLHGDGGAQNTSYEKGRNVAGDEGVLEAAFDGNHGWFWRNRGSAPVTVVVQVGGEYSEMKRVI